MREDACDDFAVALSGGPSVEPADIFLHILRFAQGRRGLAGALGIFGLGTRAACFRRIRRLLDTERTVRHRLSPWAAGALLLVALATLPYLRAANDDSPPPAAPAKSEKQPRADSNAAEKPTFELRVVGPDGKPVPHAQVEVRTEPKPTAEQIVIGKFTKQGPYGMFATTDDMGRLRVVRPSEPNHFNVDITMPGYGPYCAKWSSETHSEQIPAQFTAELEAGWSVGGVVIDGTGKPIEGVQIRPSIEFKKRPGDVKQLGLGTNLKTDAAGKWRFDSVPASMPEVFVEISQADYLPLRRRLARSEFAIEPGDGPTARLELSAGLAVTGTITDESGNVISGALIRTKFFNDEREARSGDDGKYRLIGCEPAITRIVVWALGRALEMKEVRVAPGMDPVDFQLQPGGHVRVRMLDEHGKGVPKGRIFFQRWRGHIKYFEFDHVNQYTDLDGVWEWNEAPLDEFAADICRPDGMQLQEQPLRARDEEYVFKVPPTLVVSGRVIDAQTKQPINSFRVVPGIRSAKPDIRWVRHEQFTAADGHYSVRRRDAELAHLVRIEATGYQPAVSRDIKSDEGQVTIDFALEKGANVTAQVLTPDGKPAAGAQVALGVAGSQIAIKNGRINDNSTYYCAREDADGSGTFSFPSQDGDFQLIITHPAGFAHVKATPETPLKAIALQAWAGVEGTFRIGKKPAADIPLTLMPTALDSYGDGLPHISTRYDVTTGQDGSFAFERVPPGRARIGRDLRLMADSGALEAISASLVPIGLTGGKTTHRDLGGQGRRVEGRLRPPSGHKGAVPWNFALVEAQPKGADERAEVGMTCEATVGSDGAFHLDDLPAGEYRLLVRFSRDPAGPLHDYSFTVPPAKPGDDQPVELGDLTLEGP